MLFFVDGALVFGLLILAFSCAGLVIDKWSKPGERLAGAASVVVLIGAIWRIVTASLGVF